METSSLFKELLFKDPAVLEIFFGMTAWDFEELLQLVGPHITKKDCKCRTSISPAIQHAIGLRFLASADAYSSLQFTFIILKQVI